MPGGPGEGPDGVEATISFASTPQAVAGFTSVANMQALQASISSMLQVQTGKVKVLGLRAAKVLTRRLREGALSDGRRLQQLLTGEVQADFVVICGDGDERQAATGAIEATLFDENAKQRFVNAFAALSGSSVEPNSVQCAMVDREWSKEMEGTNALSIQSDAKPAPQNVRYSLSGLHLTWIAAAVAVLISILTCLTCAAPEPEVDRESVPFLSVESDSELEKGAVPSGLLGFDPRHFKAERYKQAARAAR